MDATRSVLDHAMRRLGVMARLLAAVLLTLIARMLVSGPTFTSGLTTTVIAFLLIASLLVARSGRQHEPAHQRSISTSRP